MMPSIRSRGVPALALLFLLVPMPMTALAASAHLDTVSHVTADVVVTASRYGEDLHLSHTNIAAEELARRVGVEDIPMLLAGTPGLHAWSDSGNGVGYTYLTIRGFSSHQIAVTINDIPLNDPEDHSVYWVDVPDFASSVHDIQVQRGITNSIGGATAVGGTVNLVTDMLALERGGRTSTMFGCFNTWRTMAEYQTGLVDGRFQSALRWSRVESDGYRDRTGSKLWGVYWSGRALLGDHTLQANVYTGREESQHGWNAAHEDDLAINRRANPETYKNAVDDFRQPHYELHHGWTVSDRVSLRNTAFWIHGAGYYENLKEGETAADFSLDRSLGLAADDEVDLIRRKNVDKDQLGLVSHVKVDHGGGRTIVGGDVYDFHSDHRGNVLSVLGVNPTMDEDYYRYRGDKTAWSIYANEMWEVLPGLTLLGDLQYQHKVYRFMQDEVGNFTGADRHAYEVDYGFFNPKGGVYWDTPAMPFGGRWGLYAHIGVTHQEPGTDDLFDTWQGPDDLGVAPLFRTSVPVDETGDGVADYIEWSDPQMVEERAVNYEFGTSWRTDAVSLKINGYWMEFENEIVAYGAVDEDGMAIKGNAGTTLHRGVELETAVWLTDAHVLKVAASRSWDEHEAYTTNFDPEVWTPGEFNLSGNPISLFPEHFLTVALDSQFGAVDTSLRFRSVGRQFLDNTGNADHTIDSFATVDLAVGVDIGALLGPSTVSTRLDLRVNNLLDEEYETWGYWYNGRNLIPAAGRNFLVGVHTSF